MAEAEDWSAAIKAAMRDYCPSAEDNSAGIPCEDHGGEELYEIIRVLLDRTHEALVRERDRLADALQHGAKRLALHAEQAATARILAALREERDVLAAREAALVRERDTLKLELADDKEGADLVIAAVTAERDTLQRRVDRLMTQGPNGEEPDLLRYHQEWCSWVRERDAAVATRNRALDERDALAARVAALEGGATAPSAPPTPSSTAAAPPPPSP